MKKELNIHLLATHEKANIFDVFGTLKFLPGNPDSTYESKNKHLYFTLNERPRVGDWFIDTRESYSQIPYQCTGYTSNFAFTASKDINHPKEYCRKIIITTDTNLGLPQPNSEFVKLYANEYNNKNIFAKANVQYEEDLIKVYDNIGGHPGGHWEANPKTNGIKLIVNPNNTVDICPIADKRNKEAIEILFIKLVGLPKDEKIKILESVETFDKWIEENI